MSGVTVLQFRLHILNVRKLLDATPILLHDQFHSLTLWLQVKWTHEQLGVVCASTYLIFTHCTRHHQQKKCIQNIIWKFENYILNLLRLCVLKRGRCIFSFPAL